METLFSVVLYILYGFFGFLLLLFVLALLFGKRVKKQWEFEAEFRNDAGREFGEFDVELSQILKEEPAPTFKAKFKMSHPSLEVGQRVEIYVDDVLVMAGNAEVVGRVVLRQDAIVNQLAQPEEGQVCRVVYGGQERFSAALRPD